jgi:hypothetical protein
MATYGEGRGMKIRAYGARSQKNVMMKHGLGKLWCLEAVEVPIPSLKGPQTWWTCQ